MKQLIAIFSLFSCILNAGAAWYWPFGGDDADKGRPRLSTLMEPATRLIDSASDLADEGKVDEAVEDYRKALDELARIEIENPDRAVLPEFASVRNKRAYIESAIDSLLFSQAERHARAVAVTDTTELERRYAEERAARAAARANRGKTSSDRGREKAPESVSDIEAALSPEVPQAKPADDKAMSGQRPMLMLGEPTPAERRRKLMLGARDAMQRKDFAAALADVDRVLKESPNDAAALNLRAMIQKASGDSEAAERTLTQLIRTNPTVYYGFYNMAKLVLETRGEAGRQAARRYYLSGRESCGGPVDAFLEEKLK